MMNIFALLIGMKIMELEKRIRSAIVTATGSGEKR